MANDISQFQDGRIAAMGGFKRDRRRSADWLEGYDQVRGQKQAIGRYASDG